LKSRLMSLRAKDKQQDEDQTHLEPLRAKS
jgi:hypothetical protein